MRRSKRNDDKYDDDDDDDQKDAGTKHPSAARGSRINTTTTTMTATTTKTTIRPIKRRAGKILVALSILWGFVFAYSAYTLGKSDAGANARPTPPRGSAAAATTTTRTKTTPSTPSFSSLSIRKPALLSSSSSLNEAATAAAAAAAASFPPPSLAAGANAKVVLQPTFGTHRPESDAVFVFAEGYDLDVYVLLVSSLRIDASFVGDIVLSVSSIGKLKPGVEDYLRGDLEGIVAYCMDVRGGGINSNNDTSRRGGNRIHGMYGNESSSGGYDTPLPDPRPSRPIATARFELYWAWSLQYWRTSRILLIDARDVYFQLSPFDPLPRLSDEEDGGVLHLFEENAFNTSAAKNIGSSVYNSKWITTAYGQDALRKISNKPVICSGGTIGDQIAIEAYLRVMVKQWDDCRCNQKGCDQGYHNYAYYLGLLDGAIGIRDVIVHKQGEGLINNLAALRNSPLREQGVLQDGTDLVLNWDGSVSAVVHQFDRDRELSGIIKRRTASRVLQWKEGVLPDRVGSV